MKCYASRTGTKRNLAALKVVGWGLLVSRAGVWRTEGFNDFVADNGAWADFMAGRPFDEDGFERFLIWLESLPVKPQWIVLPDIVAGGLKSLALSTRYLNRCLSISPLVLIAVQDGMKTEDLAPLVGQNVGIFLGGSTEWKLKTMVMWGAFCKKHGLHYHVARVNTQRRIRQALSSGADSMDGSSGSRYAVTIPRLASVAAGGGELEIWRCL